jgi:hypothetical protein
MRNLSGPRWPPKVPGPGWPPTPPDPFAEFRQPPRKRKKPYRKHARARRRVLVTFLTRIVARVRTSRLS